MSVAARKWLDRQKIGIATPQIILRVLADAADKRGRCNLSQLGIAARAGLKERAVRKAIAILDDAEIISRVRRSAGGRDGRECDLIMIALDRDFDLSETSAGDKKAVGATGTKWPENGWAQPARNESFDDGRNRHHMPVAKAAPTASRVESNKYPDLYGRTHQCSGRIWQERKRQKWRACVRFDRLEFDAGRFETEPEAMRALGGALADIKHSIRSKSGSPREPIFRSEIYGLANEKLGEFLFDGGVE